MLSLRFLLLGIHELALRFGLFWLRQLLDEQFLLLPDRGLHRLIYIRVAERAFLLLLLNFWFAACLLHFHLNLHLLLLELGSVLNDLRVQGDSELDFVLVGLERTNLLEAVRIWQLIILRRQLIRVEYHSAQPVHHIAHIVDKIAAPVHLAAAFIVQATLFLNQQKSAIFISLKLS